MGLPSSGTIRFVPECDYNPANPLPRGPQGGYIDRYGNEWVVGPPRTPAAAFRAAGNPSSIFIKNKHLTSSGIRGGSSPPTTSPRSRVGVAQGLRSPGVQFRPNQLDDTFRAIVAAGRVVGTGGQTNIRVIVTNDGRVINAFPVHTR